MIGIKVAAGAFAVSIALAVSITYTITHASDGNACAAAIQSAQVKQEDHRRTELREAADVLTKIVTAKPDWTKP